MALSIEDKQDVQKHLGKALANKVKTVTKDRYMASLEGYLKKHGKDKVRSYHKDPYKTGFFD